MNYKLYSAEDFAADETFISYFLQKDDVHVQFWTRWISEHPEKIDEIVTAERLLATLYLHLPEEEKEAQYRKMENFLFADAAEPAQPHVPNRSRKWYPYAAAAVLLPALLWGMIHLSRQAKVKAVEELVYVTKHTDFRQRLILTLEDGSRVTLNSNSTLRYPQSFGKHSREVLLDGEGFFEVAKVKDRPFIVHSGALETKVLGTRFNVNTYNKSCLRVALLEGSVLAGPSKLAKRVKLAPLQQLLYTPGKEKCVMRAFDTLEVAGWRAGKLVFRNADFKTLSEKFWNSYGYQMIDQSDTRQWCFTGEYDNADYLKVIRSICFAKNLRYKIVDKQIFIKNSE